MDGGKRAHTGAQNDEGGKIRGLLCAVKSRARFRLAGVGD